MADLDAEAARLEALAPGYLEKVRAAAAARSSGGADTLEKSLEVLDETCQVDADAPTGSDSQAGHAAKVLVSRLARFYFVHLARQVSDFGASTSWFARAATERIAALEAEVAALRREVEDLRRP